MLTQDRLNQIAGIAPDWTIPQRWERFSEGEHRVWDLLFARQQRQLAGRAIAAFERGLDVLRLSRPGIPDFEELNERLFARTGWTVVSVPGLIPDDVFFEHLSRRRFPAGNFIRSREQLDYLEEPDVFHDVFGHVPLLADPAAADFMQALGARGLEAIGHGALHRLARLYWYTVEFGLAREIGAIEDLRRRHRLELRRDALRARKPRAAASAVRPPPSAAHELPDRRLPAGLFRHRQLRRRCSASCSRRTCRRSTRELEDEADLPPGS